MPLELEKLYNSRSQTAVLDWDGDCVNITYRMMAITPRKIEEISRGAENPRQLFERFILEFVTDWDILSGGEKCPITIEFLAQLRGEFLAAMYDAILANLRGDRAERDGEKKS